MNLNELKLLISSFSLPPVIMCIGSSKIISDSYGPLVGQLLKASKPNAYVYGSLDEPITALNLTEKLASIKREHPSSKIIAVDAFAGSGKHDELKMLSCGIKPGLASGKSLPRVGDASIIASGALIGGHHSLSNVYALAHLTGKIIEFCLKDRG